MPLYRGLVLKGCIERAAGDKFVSKKSRTALKRLIWEWPGEHFELLRCRSVDHPDRDEITYEIHGLTVYTIPVINGWSVYVSDPGLTKGRTDYGKDRRPRIL